MEITLSLHAEKKKKLNSLKVDLNNWQPITKTTTMKKTPALNNNKNKVKNYLKRLILNRPLPKRKQVLLLYIPR